LDQLDRKKKLKYSDVGIDVKKIKSLQSLMGKSIASTHSLPKKGNIVTGFGHYAGIIRFGDLLFSMHTDGVGSKILIAQMMNKYDTIGIDCVAMNVNDTICVGATPIGYLSYIALQETNDSLLKDLTKGLVAGARLSNMAIVGGETAILPEIITGFRKKYNFDLAGMCLGVQQKDKLLLGNSIRNGDIIIGLKSSGLHSNGYTLARKILLEKYKIDEKPEFLKTSVGKELLKPTAIYTESVLNIMETFGKKIHGLAHITGGAFTKLGRLNHSVDFILDGLPKIKGIFKQLQLDGMMDIEEMYRTFNMGIGFCIIAPEKESDDILTALANKGVESTKIGHIKGNGNGSTYLKILSHHDSTLVKL
jgi:phosphoribosylformylglycinamidine cyclo-ligase